MSFFYLIFFSFTPVLFWFWFILKEDPHPEPKVFTVLAFIFGGVAVILSYFAEYGLEYIGITGDDFPIKYFFYSAFVEEFFKFIFIALVILKTRVFDEPVDAMVYMGFSALGFAFFENFIGLMGIDEFVFESVFIVAFLRALGANFLHILASVIIGFGYVYSKICRRVFPFLVSFVIATILHFIYNWFIMQKELSFFVFPILWAVFFIVLKEFNFIKLRNGGIFSRASTQ